MMVLDPWFCLSAMSDVCNVDLRRAIDFMYYYALSGILAFVLPHQVPFNYH